MKPEEINKLKVYHNFFNIITFQVIEDIKNIHKLDQSHYWCKNLIENSNNKNIIEKIIAEVSETQYSRVYEYKYRVFMNLHGRAMFDSYILEKYAVFYGNINNIIEKMNTIKEIYNNPNLDRLINKFPELIKEAISIIFYNTIYDAYYQIHTYTRYISKIDISTISFKKFVKLYNENDYFRNHLYPIKNIITKYELVKKLIDHYDITYGLFRTKTSSRDIFQDMYNVLSYENKIERSSIFETVSDESDFMDIFAEPDITDVSAE